MAHILPVSGDHKDYKLELIFSEQFPNENP